MPLLKLNNIVKTYHRGEMDVPVLRGVSLEIERGDLVALMGASGSGKTTLMNILGCLDRPTSGQFWLDGEEISRLSRDARAVIRNRQIGFVFQNFNLLPRTSALDNVMMPVSYNPRTISDAECRRRATHWLEQVGLAERMDHHPSQLSGGQQQRVAIARSLINEPALLLADEPTGNLDPDSRRIVLDFFDELHAEGRTIVMVTHDAAAAERAAVRLKLVDGAIIEDVSISKSKAA